MTKDEWALAGRVARNEGLVKSYPLPPESGTSPFGQEWQEMRDLLRLVSEKLDRVLAKLEGRD